MIDKRREMFYAAVREAVKDQIDAIAEQVLMEAAEKLPPEDVYCDADLTAWAENNGFALKPE